MATRGAKVMLSGMMLKYESVGVVVANDVQGIITIDNFAQLNMKSVEGLCQVLQRPGGTTGELFNHRVAVSEMAEVNQQGKIYFINNFKMIGST